MNKRLNIIIKSELIRSEIRIFVRSSINYISDSKKYVKLES